MYFFLVLFLFSACMYFLKTLLISFEFTVQCFNEKVNLLWGTWFLFSLWKLRHSPYHWCFMVYLYVFWCIVIFKNYFWLTLGEHSYSSFSLGQGKIFLIFFFFSSEICFLHMLLTFRCWPF